MSFIELAKKRYSCRNYQERKVEKEKLDTILEAGRVAPTAANLQPQRLIVIQEKDGLMKLAKCANVFKAPLAIIICADKDVAWTRPNDSKVFTDVDASIITDHMMMAATELELNSLWVCYFDTEIMKKEFNIPDNYIPVNILALGYESGKGQTPDRHDRTRLAINKTVVYETF